VARARINVKSGADVRTRMTALRARRSTTIQRMRDLDPWRWLDLLDVIPLIWDNAPENAPQHTVMKPDIASVTDAAISMFIAKEPTIRAAPRNTIRLASLDAANEVERVVRALWRTVDRFRPKPLLAESTDHDIHRGELVGMALWLSPEERGEERTEVPSDEYLLGANVTRLFPDEETLPPTERITTPGRFPLWLRIFDPAECYFTLGADERVIEFAHEYTDTWLGLADAFPDIVNKEYFRGKYENVSQLDNAVRVIDYWTETHHAILIDDQLYKAPTEHKYPRLPVVVRLANARTKRDSRNVNRHSGTPLCQKMLPSVIKMSKADSLSESYLEEAALFGIEHSGIEPGKSPYVIKNKDGEWEYTGVIHGRGGRMNPAFFNERFRPIEPPPVVPMLQEYKLSRQRDAALVSFPEPMLSGAQQVDISGYAYSQIKQIPMAKLEPYKLALDGFLSDLLSLCVEVIVRWWDLPGDIPLVLTEAVYGTGQQGQQQNLPVTKAAFEMIGAIEVEVNPEVPVNEEAEKTLLFQARATRGISQLTFVDRLGYAEDASAEIERMDFEDMRDMDPTIKMAGAQNYMKKNNLIQATPRQPAAAAAPPGMPGTGPPGAPVPPSTPAGPSPTAASAVGPQPSGLAPGGMPITPELIARAKQDFPELARMPDEQVAMLLTQAMQARSA